MWTSRIPVAFPADQLAAAKALAHLIDPDQRGDLTFSADRVIDGYVIAQIPFVADFEPLVRGRDPQMWRMMIDQLAAERGRQNIDDATLELLRTSMLYDEECAGLLEDEGRFQ